MADESCMYCACDERVTNLMVPICELAHTRVYLYRESTFPGRCVVVYKEHIQKFTQLSRQQRIDLMDDVYAVADAVTRLYGADKINYLILGDLCPHLHVHVVPKYEGKTGWGSMFAMMPEPSQFLPGEEAYQAEAAKIREALSAK